MSFTEKSKSNLILFLGIKTPPFFNVYFLFTTISKLNLISLSAFTMK
jgi:hypothetical protein